MTNAATDLGNVLDPAIMADNPILLYRWMATIALPVAPARKVVAHAFDIALRRFTPARIVNQH